MLYKFINIYIFLKLSPSEKWQCTPNKPSLWKKGYLITLILDFPHFNGIVSLNCGKITLPGFHFTRRSKSSRKVIIICLFQSTLKATPKQTVYSIKLFLQSTLIEAVPLQRVATTANRYNLKFKYLYIYIFYLKIITFIHRVRQRHSEKKGK